MLAASLTECLLERCQFHKLAGHLKSPLRMVGLCVLATLNAAEKRTQYPFRTSHMLVQNLEATLKICVENKAFMLKVAIGLDSIPKGPLCEDLTGIRRPSWHSVRIQFQSSDEYITI